MAAMKPQRRGTGLIGRLKNIKSLCGRWFNEVKIEKYDSKPKYSTSIERSSIISIKGIHELTFMVFYVWVRKGKVFKLFHSDGKYPLWPIKKSKLKC